MELCSIKACTGCMACVNICNSNAIVINPDEEGFLRPHIIQDACINCGRCVSVCPHVTTGYTSRRMNNTKKKKVYACWQKSKEILKESTSGGAFTAFAMTILAQNGSVYGAGFDSDLSVVHKKITTHSQIQELRGSKYVQSDIGTSYREVKEDLEHGKKVLFTGTPCQIDGLYQYLGKEYSGSLYTIDLICHGVPSPRVYKDYIHFMERKYQSRIRSYYFRNKKPGWYVSGTKIIFENGMVYEQDNWHDFFFRGFLRDFYLRPSCYQCRYADIIRPADITIGDDWGYQETGFRDRDNDQGISMVMINNENGETLFRESRRKMHVFRRTVEDAVRGNRALSKSFGEPQNRTVFWEDYNELSFANIAEKYLYAEDIPIPLQKRNDNIVRARKGRIKRKIKHRAGRMVFILAGQKRYDSIKNLFGSNPAKK